MFNIYIKLASISKNRSSNFEVFTLLIYVTYAHVSYVAFLVVDTCTRGDQKVRGKMLFNRIAFIDFNENL